MRPQTRKQIQDELRHLWRDEIEAPDTKDAAADMAEEVLMMEAERVRRDAENGGATVSRKVRSS